MTITVAAVYAGGGVLKLERPIDLEENARVNVTIETEPPALADDATGWKAAEEFIGMWKGGTPGEAVGAEHDKHLYK
jgi:predicted DNA-binding antitoxin AbrB/MazE fold protein